MRVRRKNILRVVIVFLVLLEITSVFLMWKSANNKDITLNDVKLKSVNKNSGLAIMIEQEDGTYKESSSNTWPEEMMFNEEKSGCIDNEGNAIDGALTYEGGIANIKTKSSSYCYLYFDIIKDDVTIAISTDGVKGTMPTSGAYANSATCSSGSIIWNQKYQRIEIGNLTKVGNKCNLTFTKDTSSKTLLKTEVESNATINTNGYRYSGNNPDNYIWFNNEMWRIIGSIPTCLSASCGTNTTNLVKIIRKDSIGGLAYDAKYSGNTYTGTWGSNTLYTLLNNYYYGASNGTNTSYCYGSQNIGAAKCDYTTIGISTDSYYGKMIKNVYWNTGASSSGTTVSSVYTSEIATRTISGYVGLMAASDYGYAASSSNYSTNLIYYGTEAITKTNWLYAQGSEWINIKDSSDATKALFVSNGGQVGVMLPYNGYTVRPVIYLDSNVYVVSGTGTELDPYIIGM